VNIVIDQGNTSVKVALFEGKTLFSVFQYKSLSEELLQKIFSTHFPESAILCSVKQMDSEVVAFLRSRVPAYFELNEAIALPFTLDYRTPHTLGADRVAAAAGAFFQKPDENLLVIDVGTAITFDLVEKNGVYRGGNISPGPELRFKSLNHYTDRLPLLNGEGELPALGYDTETAIRAGVIRGIVREIDSYMDDYKKNYNVFTFLTGGYSFYFESKLKSPIFADGNLVLKGLNEILNYQYEKN
jgi:type III pantothenate kinase